MAESGAQLPEEFARQGRTVLVIDPDGAASAETVAQIARSGGVASAYQLDVADNDAYAALAERTRFEHGVPDVVINNAGAVSVGSFMDYSFESWRSTLGTHLMGTVHGCRLFGAQMVANRTRGHVVNLSSIAGIVPPVSAPAYLTAKAGVEMLTECLAAELAPHHIRVTAVCPSASEGHRTAARPIARSVFGGSRAS